MQPQIYTSCMAAVVRDAVYVKLHIHTAPSHHAGAHLRGLTAPKQSALAEHLAAAAGGAAAQLPHGRHLLQGKVQGLAGAGTARAMLDKF